jgi:hypothetical protein
MENFREIIFKVIYNEKKVLKSTFKKINIKEIINTCLQLDESNFAIKNRFVLGLAKIYVRQYKYLLDEVNELLLKMNHKESIRIIKNKNINLKIEKNDYFITDDILQDKDDDKFESVNYENDWVNFDNVSIEEMRDESGLVGSTLIENVVEPLKKKRKIIEDEITEYNATFYRKNICNSKNTLDFEIKPNFLNKNFNEFRISDVFMKNILIKQNERLSEIEGMRDQTTVGDLDVSFEPDFDNYNVEHSSEDNKYSFLLEQNDNFIFNSALIASDKITKAKEFLNLLELASEGKIKCIQEKAFSPILCKREG